MQQKGFKMLLKHVKMLRPRGWSFIIGDLSLNDDQIPYAMEIIPWLKKTETP